MDAIGVCEMAQRLLVLLHRPSNQTRGVNAVGIFDFADRGHRAAQQLRFLRSPRAARASASTP
jgi:hypothetical protein